MATLPVRLAMQIKKTLRSKLTADLRLAMPSCGCRELLLLQTLQLLQAQATLLELIRLLLPSLLDFVSSSPAARGRGRMADLLTFWTSLCSAAASSTAGT